MSSTVDTFEAGVAVDAEGEVARLEIGGRDTVTFTISAGTANYVLEVSHNGSDWQTYKDEGAVSDGITETIAARHVRLYINAAGGAGETADIYMAAT